MRTVWLRQRARGEVLWRMRHGARSTGGQAPRAEVSAEAGERRQVTVLYADVVGYSKLSSENDPEEMRRLLNRFFDVVDSLVHSHGGAVDKHIGDAVMARFGAPIAHSDDPERAVRTALAAQAAMDELSRELGRPIQVHIGIASGLVVASGVGSRRTVNTRSPAKRSTWRPACLILPRPARRLLPIPSIAPCRSCSSARLLARRRSRVGGGRSRCGEYAVCAA